MIMRKFIIELHTDGSMTWAEYTEPHSQEDRDLICSRAFQSVAEDLDTFPCCHFSPAAKAAYLAGAASMATVLRKAF